MIWTEPIDHVSDCYFCLTDLNTFGNIKYPDVKSVIYPVPHSDILPVPTYLGVQVSCDHDVDASGDHCSARSIHDPDCAYKDESVNPTSSSVPTFNQHEINDLTRDLGLSKELSELLASRLDEKKLLQKDAKITYFRDGVGMGQFRILGIFKGFSGIP